MMVVRKPTEAWRCAFIAWWITGEDGYKCGFALKKEHYTREVAQALELEVVAQCSQIQSGDHSRI